MEEKELWDEVKGMFQASDRKVCIYEGEENVGVSELEGLGLSSMSVLGVVVSHTSGICIDNWVRMIGQSGASRRGIADYNELKTEEKRFALEGMLVVAQDIVGGIFAINRDRFEEGIRKVWYFAPDTLDWECLDMSYPAFAAWLVREDIDSFYRSMRWEKWREDCEKAHFDDGISIYPFLWAKECNIEKASKRVVPFEELAGINFEYAMKLSGL